MYLNNRFGDIPEDLRSQNTDATRRRLEAAPPSEIMNWAIDAIGKHAKKMTDLGKKYEILTKRSSLASIELRRLRGLSSAATLRRVSYLRDMHRSLIAANSGISRTLNSCRQALKDSTTNYQLIRQVLSNPLTDEGEKIATQNKLSNSLKILDEKFSACSQAVSSQKKLGDQLAQAISKLLDTIKGKLPPDERERIDQEDKIAKLALDYQVSQPELIAKNVSSKSTLPEPLGIGIYEIAAIAVGILIGVRLCK